MASEGNGILGSMLAAQVVEFNKPYKIHEIPTPQTHPLHPNFLLLRIAVASYCHTDSMVLEGRMGTELPCIGSHEGTGVVAAVGSSLTSQFKIGDRVMAGLPLNRCGQCPDCEGAERYSQYCPNIDGHIGVMLDGAFAEYMLVDGREAARLPDSVKFETAAPLACAGCTIYRAILETGMVRLDGSGGGEGKWIALSGAGGGLGHIGIQMAKAMGLKVLGLDARDEAIKLAKEVGADAVLDIREYSEPSKLVKKVAEVTGTAHRGKHAGVDATVVLSEHESAAGTACAITRMHGTIVQIAQPPEVKVPFRELIFRDIRIKGSLLCTKKEAVDMLKLVADHQIQVKVNAFHGLREIPKLMDLASSGKLVGKGIVIVDEQLLKEKN